MTAPRTLGLVLLLVVGMTVAAPGVVAAQDGTSTSTPTDSPTETTTTDDDTDENETDTDNSSSMTVGQRLAGVVATQQEQVKGDVEKRAFGLKVAQAASNNSRAEIVGEQIAENKERLQELQAERKELREAKKSGNISQAEYTTRMAELNGQIQNLKAMNNETKEAAKGIPEETLAENGVNVTAIQTLKTQAENLSGQEVAEIARTIAGPPSDAGADGERGPPGERGEANETTTDDGKTAGPPDNPGNQNDSDTTQTPDSEADDSEDDSTDDEDESEQQTRTDEER